MPGAYVKVPDPQCAQVAAALTSSCTITAVALADPNNPGQAALDPVTGLATNVILQNPQPGNRGTLGQKTLVGIGTWSLDANLSKTFRVSESKSVQIRVDGTNITNHPSVGAPNLSLTSNTAFGQITGKNNDHRQFQGQLRFSF